MIEFEKALQKFLDEYLTLCEKLHTNQQEKMLLDKNSPYNVLKRALTEFKTVKEVNPGEALKDLKVIENNIIYTLSDCDIDDEVCQNLQYAKTKIPAIEQALIDKQELERFTRLVIEKKVEINVFIQFDCKRASDYNDFASLHYNCFTFFKKEEYYLSEEEFTFIKKMITKYRLERQEA